MRKFIFAGVILALCGLVNAQEIKKAVRDDTFLVQKEISVWRTDKAQVGKVPIYACQAVRLDGQWLLTAAHCVYNACRASRPCMVEITLAESNVRARARVEHSHLSPQVFIYDGFYPGQNRISSVDVALIHLDPAHTTYSFETLGEDGWSAISQAQFERALRTDPEAKAQYTACGVRLISTATAPTSLFLFPVVVPRTTDGAISYLVSPTKDIFYSTELQHFISPGFGVRRGNSGGGIYTPQGDLVGVVSSLVFARDGSAAFQNEEGKTVLTLKNANDYFLFTGFNGATLNFIRNRVPSLRTISAESGFIHPTDKTFKEILELLNTTAMNLEE